MESDSSCLDLGTTRLRCLLPRTLGPADLDPAYAPFWRADDGSRVPSATLSFDAPQGDVVGWSEAPDAFRTPAWSLRRSPGRVFVVGTLFEPPRPFWAASADPLLSRLAIARLDPNPSISEVYLVESALRILGRIVLIHEHASRGTGVVVHTAAAEVSGRMYLFLGRSGAGKSTISRRLLGRADAGIRVVNDDRVILTREAGSPPAWTAWGTPWPGELGISLDVSAPAAGLLLLEKSDRTSLRALPAREALTALLPLVSVPWYDPELLAGALEVCAELVREVPVYVLRFRPDESAVEAVLGLSAR